MFLVIEKSLIFLIWLLFINNEVDLNAKIKISF